MSKVFDLNWFDKKFLPTERFVVNALFRKRISDVPNKNSEEELLQYAGQNGVSALLYKKLSSRGDQSLFQDVLSKLKNEYLKTLVLNTNLLNKASEINTVLSEEGFSLVFLKGILLAPFLYRDLALRPMSDIDLLVPDKDVKRAYDLLISKGAVPADPLEKDHVSNHHLPMIMFKSAPVEVHRFLTPKDSDYFIPPEDIFSNKISWSNEKMTLPGPSFTDAFIYMSIHVYYTFLRGGMRLSWMYDFYLLSMHEDKVVDIRSGEFRERVKEWGAEYPVRFITVLLSLLSGEKPEDNDWNKDKKLLQDISLAASFFRNVPDDSVLFSYRLIWEQVKNTKGLKNKLNIFKTKLFRRSDENVIIRFWKLLSRFMGMFYNSLMLTINRLLRRY